MEIIPKNNYDYYKQQWRESTPERRRRGKMALGIAVAIWLAGAMAAFLSVSGLVGPGMGWRLLGALLMGPLGMLWAFLKLIGVVVETAQQPNMLYMALVFASGGCLVLTYNHLAGEPSHEVMQQRRQAQQERAQGRVGDEEVVEKLAIEEGVPLAQVRAKKKTAPVGVDYATGEGHALIVGPTRSGKGLHLTETLLRWPGAAIVVDPKAEQFARTAGYRRQHFGPVYRLPGHQVHLSYYYDHLLDRDSVFELHNHFLRPGQSRERIFADKSRSLFLAGGQYGRAHRLNSLRVVLDGADSDPVAVLSALERVAEARRFIRLFTDGLPPTEYQENRFATSAFGTFTTQLAGYQKHIDTIAPTRNGETVIPRDWAKQGATIYITYSLADLEGVGGVVAAIIAGLIRYQIRKKRRERILVAIDELPSVGLYNVADYLSTVGSYGMTMLLYAQAVSQLYSLYERDGTQSILANTVHQVWFPAADMETARVLSDLYGTTYKAMPASGTSRRDYYGAQQGGRYTVDHSHGQGWQIRPALEPGEVMSLPKDRVIVLTQADRQYRFVANRLNPIHRFETLPAPPTLPRFVPGPRRYTDWNAPAPQNTASGAPGRPAAEGADESDDGVTPDVM